MCWIVQPRASRSRSLQNWNLGSTTEICKKQDRLLFGVSLQPGGYRRLGHAKTFGSLDDASAIDDRGKETKMLDFHRFSLWPVISIIDFTYRSAGR